MRRPMLAWLGHPVSIVALAVMILNDHWLKAAYGTWWTGKLSDVAGLVFFPALLAAVAALAVPARVAARWGTERLVLAAVAVTAVGFTWVKGTGAGAATASAVLSALAGPSEVLRDPTDLLALPALGLAAWLGLREASAGAADAVAGADLTRREATRASAVRKALGVALLPVAVLASVATGAPPNPSAVILQGEAGEIVLMVDAAGYYGDNAAFTWEDGSWSRLPWNETPPSDWVRGVGYQYEGFEPLTMSCVPDDPSVCFSATGIGASVSVSEDGGRTSHVEWEVTPEQAEHVAEMYRVQPEEIVTRGVAVLPDGEGYVVVAANGADGLAVRSADGTWERTGFEGLDLGEVFRLAPLEGEPPIVAFDVDPTFLAGVFSALSLRFPALWFASRRLEISSPTKDRALIVAGTLAVAAATAATAVAVWRVNSDHVAYHHDPDSNDFLLPLFGLAFVTLLAIATAAVAQLLRPATLVLALGGIVAAGGVGAIAAYAAAGITHDSGWPSTWVWLAAIAGAGLAWVNVVALGVRSDAGSQEPTGIASGDAPTQPL